MEINIRIKERSPLCATLWCSLLTGLVLIGHGIVDTSYGFIQITIGSISLFGSFIMLFVYFYKKREEGSVITIIPHIVENPIDIISTSNGNCCVCLDRGREIAFIPCGHSVCSGCHANLSLCPLCRSLIKSRLRLY
jgi:hypothetical protein